MVRNCVEWFVMVRSGGNGRGMAWSGGEWLEMVWICSHAFMAARHHEPACTHMHVCIHMPLCKDMRAHTYVLACADQSSLLAVICFTLIN